MGELRNSNPNGRSIALAPYPPLILHAIGFKDGNHKIVKIGDGVSSTKVRVYRNPFDNEPTLPQFGGVLAAPKSIINVKYRRSKARAST